MLSYNEDSHDFLTSSADWNTLKISEAGQNGNMRINVVFTRIGLIGDVERSLKEIS